MSRCDPSHAVRLLPKPLPNWVDNSLEVNGSNGAAVVARLLDDQGRVDFNRIIPMPAILEGSVAGTNADFGLFMLGVLDPHGDQKLTRDCLRRWSGATYDEGIQQWLRQQPDAMEFEAAGRKAAECIAATGYANWYDWCVDHWGTKWNAIEAGGGIDADGRAGFGFRTVWEPPLPVIAKLSSEFPESTFVLNYVDEYDDRSRYADFKAGVMIDRGTHDDDPGGEIPDWSEVREYLEEYWSQQSLLPAESGVSKSPSPQCESARGAGESQVERD